jgi:aldehyde:ferredoxin oxidoreductase
MSITPGFAGKILKIDLSSRSVSHIPTQDYGTRFIGGRGIAAKIYWDEVSPKTGPFDPENRLLLFTGPLAGFPGLAGSRWTVCGKSPTTDQEGFCYSNLGGGFGARLKFAGYDGIVVYGKSDRPVYLLIRDDDIEIRDAAALWGKGAAQVRQALKAELGKSVKVVVTGPAGENLVPLATLLADQDASASCGFGAVMGSKNLKAIAVAGTGRVKAADPDRLREVTRHIREMRKGYPRIIYPKATPPKMKWDFCYGCIRGCGRAVFETPDGNRGKLLCGSGIFYQEKARKYYGEYNDVQFRATRLCDDYGLDTEAIDGLIMWLSRCYKAGILGDDSTGIPLSKMGSYEFIEALVRKTALKEGFGEVLAQGTVKAAKTVSKEAEALVRDYISKATVATGHGPRLYITNALLYATEPRQPIHQLHAVGFQVLRWLTWAYKQEGDFSFMSSSFFREIARTFWGSEIAGDLSTYEGKAMAAKKIQDREYVKESLVVCDFYWPMFYFENTEDHRGDPTLESQVYSAVTGNEMDEEALNRVGERIFNLQRAVRVREGLRGRQDDWIPEAYFTVPLKMFVANPECLVPGRDGEVTSRKGEVVDRDKFEEMKTEYYRLRGWDTETGLQTKKKLEELGLSDIAGELEKGGFLSET